MIQMKMITYSHMFNFKKNKVSIRRGHIVKVRAVESSIKIDIAPKIGAKDKNEI